MRLAAKILKNVASVNNWYYANQAYVQEGQPNLIYFQIVNLDQIPANDLSSVLPDFPLRYIPQGVSSVEATFPALDDSEVFTVVATQPFADDKSIWLVSLTSSQTPNSGNFSIKLTEAGVDKFFKSVNGVSVTMNDNGGC